MDAYADATEKVTVSDILGLASWDRERSSEELRSFIDMRHAALPNSDEVE